MGGHGNAEALMGHRLHGGGATPTPPMTWGAAGGEGDKRQSQLWGARAQHNPLPTPPGPGKRARRPGLGFMGLFSSLPRRRREPHSEACGIPALKHCFLCLLSHPQVSPFGLLRFSFPSCAPGGPYCGNHRGAADFFLGSHRGVPHLFSSVTSFLFPSHSESARELGTFSFFIPLKKCFLILF